MGAGVLCVSKNLDGEIVLLLGKEREVPGWRHGSLKWCGFSGRAEEGETAIVSAAREFVEESCSAVMLSERSSLPAKPEDVSLILQKAISVSHTVKAPPPSEMLLYHVTFICEVPFDEGAPDRFLRVHDDLKKVDAVFKVYHRIKKSVERMPRFFLPGFAVAEQMVTVNLRVDVEQDLVFVDFFDGLSADPLLMKTWKMQVSPLVAKEAVALSEAWREITDFVEKERHSDIFAHPAVLLTTHHKMLVSAYINRCYLEKTELAWFRLDDLESTDRWKAREDFRRNFLESVRSFGPQIRSLYSPGVDVRSEKETPRACLCEGQETTCVC